ncbi:hypothetical protein [Microbacterium lacus]|uniref:PucR family transcriptional regulator n=1 Tax=Microbacterium lacus TaxID=415217 RepID=A0ABN2FY69_9MICO
MQELVGRLTAVDAEATETLKVIAYFDALVNGHATTEVLLRGAAILSGCAAGQTVGGKTMRVDATGTRAVAPPGEWPSRSLEDGGFVWIERTGPAHANDEMILERLAIAAGIAYERTSPAAASRRALQTIIDDQASAEARSDAAKRLHVDVRARYRIVATPDADPAVPTGRVPVVVVGTPYGPVRAMLAADSDGTADCDDARDGDKRQRQPRTGIGIPTAPASLPESWASALVALRLSSPREPVVDAAELGALLPLARVADEAPHTMPDAAALSDLVAAHPGAAALLDAIATTESLRAASVETGLHHSTVQARAGQYSDVLGFDIRSPRGKVRLSLALALYRLATSRFD